MTTKNMPSRWSRSKDSRIIRNYKSALSMKSTSSPTSRKMSTSLGNQQLKTIFLSTILHSSPILIYTLLHSASSLQNMRSFVEMLKTNNNFYFVYEYCNGGNLEGLIKKDGHLDQRRSLLIFKELLDAFQVLNKYSIMHRDLKPDNIFFSNGVVKLGDFGFCKSLEKATMTKTMLGSPIYMAPEILRGETYSAKADIWSLGVVLYEMLYGYCPFQSDSIPRLIEVLKETELDFPNNVYVSEETKALMSRMLTKDPVRRIQWMDILKVNITTDGRLIAPGQKVVLIMNEDEALNDTITRKEVNSDRFDTSERSEWTGSNSQRSIGRGGDRYLPPAPAIGQGVSNQYMLTQSNPAHPQQGYFANNTAITSLNHTSVTSPPQSPTQLNSNNEHQTQPFLNTQPYDNSQSMSSAQAPFMRKKPGNDVSRAGNNFPASQSPPYYQEFSHAPPNNKGFPTPNQAPPSTQTPTLSLSFRRKLLKEHTECMVCISTALQLSRTPSEQMNASLYVSLLLKKAEEKLSSILRDENSNQNQPNSDGWPSLLLAEVRELNNEFPRVFSEPNYANWRHMLRSKGDNPPNLKAFYAMIVLLNGSVLKEGLSAQEMQGEIKKILM